MKKVIFSMKAFYISLFVVLFFPLGLMGQGQLVSLLQEDDFLYIMDGDHVMVAEDSESLGVTLGVSTEVEGDNLIWKVVTDNSNNNYLQNVKYKRYLKFDKITNLYSLVENFNDATPISADEGEWYLGSTTGEQSLEAYLSCTVEEYKKKWAIVTYYYKWEEKGKYTGKGYLDSKYPYYMRPHYDVGTSRWIGTAPQLYSENAEANSFKLSVTVNGKPVNNYTSVSEVEGALRIKSNSLQFTSDNNPNPPQLIKKRVNTSTQAFVLDRSNFIYYRPNSENQKVHEFHEVIYAAKSGDEMVYAGMDYGTVTLELPVDGIHEKNSADFIENLGDALKNVKPGWTIEETRKSLEKELNKLPFLADENSYYLRGFYRWYSYPNGGVVDGLVHEGFYVDLNKLEGVSWILDLLKLTLNPFEIPASYKQFLDYGDVLFYNQNPGITTYKLPSTFNSESNIKIACDVSNYDDYQMCITSNGEIKVTEPTLSYRVIYEIRHADKMLVDDNKSDNPFEYYNVIAPERTNIVIGPEYFCSGEQSNYYMSLGNDKKIYKIDKSRWFKITDEEIKSLGNNGRIENYEIKPELMNNRLITISAPAKEGVEYYRLINNGLKLHIAKFVVTGYARDIVGPLAEDDVKVKDPEERLHKFYPDLTDEEKAKLKFDLKAELDFDDIYDVDNPKEMYSDPLPWEDISAGFVYPGLISSGNKQRDPQFVAMSEYALLSTTDGYKKRGSTLPTITNHGEDLPDGEKGKGYFLYVDATKKPSKVADLSINGDLCPNSKIYVSAWIANAFKETSNNLDLSTYPNLNFVMMGVMTDDNGKITSETHIATFTTGDIEPKEGQWQNIMFEFVTTEVEYDKYRLRIENNNAAYFGVGNDFAIDDIKIYMESRTEATLTQNRSCPAWSPDASDFNKLNVAILKSNVIDISSGDVPMYYSWFKKKGENADGSSVEVEHLPLDNYINTTNDTTNGNYGIITVNKEWIDIVKERLDTDGNGIISFPDEEPFDSILVSEGKFIYVYASVDDYLSVQGYDGKEEAAGYFFTVEGSGDDALLALHIVHKDSLFQQHEEYTSIVTPMNLPEYIEGFSADSLSDEKRALEALYNELKCGDRSQLTILPYSAIMLKGTSSNYDFDFTQAVVKHLAKGKNYTFAVEAYYEGTETKDDSTVVKVMKPYNCAADWLLVTNDSTKWTDAQAIINWQANRNAQLTLSEDSILMTSDSSVTSFPVANFSGPLHYIAIPDPNKAVVVDNDTLTPCAIPVEIYLYDSIPATLADPTINNNKVDTLDRPVAICNEPIIVRIPNSLVEDGNTISLNLDIDYFDEYLFAEIAKYNAQKGNANPYPLSEIYLYDANGQAHKFNITAKDENNQTLTLDLLNKDDDVSIKKADEATLSFGSGEKYHFAGLNKVNGVTITPPFQFDVYVVPDEVVWTGDDGTAWHNDANWNPAIIPMSHTNVVIPGNTTNKPVLNPAEGEFEVGAYEWLEHDIVLTKNEKNVLVDNTSAVLNSCKDIYFDAGAQLANQHMLNYERAFVDVPFTGNDDFGKSNDKFKIMSFPLRNVYRGDLYIPKAGDGTFAFANPVAVDNRAYNSFYVKAYNSEIKKNTISGDKTKPEAEKVVVVEDYTYESTGGWSNPTSVLNFEFEEAHGYAVSLNDTIEQGFVRLPKSATEYYLFMDFGNGNEEELNGPTWPKYEISWEADDNRNRKEHDGREFAHKLIYDKNSVVYNEQQVAEYTTNDTNKVGNIFLIGNPFMTDMNAEKFLEVNGLEKVYYIYNSDGTIGVSWPEKPDGYQFINSIPPFGAMFVKGNSKTQTFKFTPEMMSYEQSTEPSTQQRAPRMVEERELLTITAEVDGARSRTYIEKDFAANNEYLDTEDADLLVLDADLTPISVYSVATGAALAYNSVTDMEFVPLGLLLVDSTIVAESVRFTFDGVDYFYDELYLYDALYNSYLPLIDGVALELEMPESGELRYFITDTKHNVGGGVTTSDDLVEGSKVCVFTTEGEACIIADDIISEATVYDIAGRLIYYSDQISSSQHNISLPNGVYMLKVVVNSNLSTHKIILK